jgi:hypothetical protein
MVKLSVCKSVYKRNGECLLQEISTETWTEEKQTLHSQVKSLKRLLSLAARKMSTESQVFISVSRALPATNVVCLVYWNLLQFKVNSLSPVSNYSQVSDFICSFLWLLMYSPLWAYHCRCIYQRQVFLIPSLHPVYNSGNELTMCEIVGFRRGWNEVSRLLGYYAACGGLTPTFREYLSVPSSRVKQAKDCLTLRKNDLLKNKKYTKTFYTGISTTGNGIKDQGNTVQYPAPVKYINLSKNYSCSSP